MPQLLPVVTYLIFLSIGMSYLYYGVGTDGGGGLLMYADYFKQSHMVGFDPYNQPESVKNIDQISHFMVDAYTDEAIVIAKTFGEFGVIIDDGPHCVGSQSWFVKNYPQLLSADGVAIVEDIPDDERLNILISCVPEGFNYEVRDLRLINGRYDDLLLIITKK